MQMGVSWILVLLVRTSLCIRSRMLLLLTRSADLPSTRVCRSSTLILVTRLALLPMRLWLSLRRVVICPRWCPLMKITRPRFCILVAWCRKCRSLLAIPLFNVRRTIGWRAWCYRWRIRYKLTLLTVRAHVVLCTRTITRLVHLFARIVRPVRRILTLFLSYRLSKASRDTRLLMRSKSLVLLYRRYRAVLKVLLVRALLVDIVLIQIVLVW